MPLLTRWFVKTSFVCLGLALVAGILNALQPLWNLPWLGGVFPVYVHLLVLGWASQLIFGIAFWMFPKFSLDNPRRSEALGWWTYGLLNAGLLLRAVAEPVNSVEPGPMAGWALLISAGLQLSAGLGFVWNTWSRIRER